MTDIIEHLKLGATTVCHAWSIKRTDGVEMGFTDHDRTLAFAGLTFEPDSGFSGLSVFQETGLSIDNTEALGVLRDDRISAADLHAGRYDGAEVTAYLVNWQDPSQFMVEFRGHIGEITTKGQQFQAEIRGQTETLNRNIGQVFQSPCAALLGDKKCQFNLNTPGYQFDVPITTVLDRHRLEFADFKTIEQGWFARGLVSVETGPAVGLRFGIKSDQIKDGARIITLWDEMPIMPDAGDRVRVIAGCDKQFKTCQAKFNNVVNFRGFPDIPSYDWVLVHPTHSNQKSGGSRR